MTGLFQRIPLRVRRRSQAQVGASNATAGERRAKYVYQILLSLSLVLNGILAVRSHVNSERLGALDEANTKLQQSKLALETQLLQANNTPAFTFSRLRYELATFGAQLKKKQLIPFLDTITDFRVVQNQILDTVERGLADLRRGVQTKGSVTFLMVANVSPTTAYGSSVATDGGLVELGDLLPQSVVLIPSEFVDGRGREAFGKKLGFSTLRYHVSLGSTRTIQEMQIPPPVSQAWVPTLEQVRGIGRAHVDADDGHIGSIISTPPR